MHAESNTCEDSSIALAEEISPRSPWRVTAVEALPDLRLRVCFVDGVVGIVDMSGFVHSAKAGVFAKLADPYFFSLVKVEYGAVTWSGGLDLAPDAMYDAIREHREWTL
jgi:hypothetical protein